MTPEFFNSARYLITVLRTIVFLIFASIASVAQAYTGPETCAAIPDDGSRLACFDSHFGSTSQATAAQYGGLVLSSDAESLMVEAGVSPVLTRRAQEFALSDQWFSITPHRPNYVLPATVNSTPDYDDCGLFGEAFSDWEIKFQLSLKALIAKDLWRGSSVWFGYTQQSYWQLYAEDDASSPFRETNHEPEVFWEVPVNFDLLGWNARLATFALNHQSNGRAEPLSRSWNRVTGELVFDRGPFVASVKSWARFEEDEESDDNPDIEDYMGRLQLGLAYKRGEQVFALGFKNNLRSDNRSGLELNWTFPLAQHFKGSVQLYSGYGENLIDGDNYNNRIGVGIALTDWL